MGKTARIIEVFPSIHIDEIRALAALDHGKFVVVPEAMLGEWMPEHPPVAAPETFRKIFRGSFQ